MSKGISISSINQIKELAEEKRYAEALEILDTQDLDKSINPQFLRVSGEIFRKNKRYYDSRRILLKAHQMAPQGTRIIFELIQLYLELGYFTLANKYYEEYNFYVGQEDTQKDFVEYIVKKANGAEIKELASILIPILERMPEDIWNYEAVLLYDKLDRKDKALDECRFILENFKNSVYTDRVISYIDDKLDVDKEFCVYPREEQEEDVDVFGSLIDLEKEILEKDYLAMYPPEARIMVEVEDRDGIEVKPIKEKKPKKKRAKKPKKSKALSENEEQEVLDDVSTDIKEETVSVSNVETEKESNKKTEEAKEDSIVDKEDTPDKETAKSKADSVAHREDISGKESDIENSSIEHEKEEQKTDNVTDESVSEEEVNQEASLNEEELIKKNREEALEKLLSKKFDTEKIKESAKQIAESVKSIDTSKAKSQVKNVTDLVTDNVKKASDALSDAVGTKAVMEEAAKQDYQNDSETIVDGIIESILEPPKQSVGQVVMNEELDSLVPDSIEAMSADEIAEIESRKEEQERLELEALETSVKLEEEKRAKKKRSKSEDNEEKQSLYSELKNKYIEEYVAEELVADSLGFISVVHSDVDQVMEEGIPDTAQMLRQMIGNKEFYGDENSLGFESKESYENHGFEIEFYDSNSNNQTENFVYIKQNYNSDVYKVEDIYAEKTIVSFDDLAPGEVIPMEDYVQSEEWLHRSQQIEEPVIFVVNENFEVDESISALSEDEKNSDEKDSVNEEGRDLLEEAGTQPEEANYEVESTQPEETTYEEESTQSEETTYEEVSVQPEETTYEEESTQPEEATYEEVSVQPEETTYEEESTQPEETTYEEVSNPTEETLYEKVDARFEEVSLDDMDSFEPVIGEQLSFEMITPMEKARKERMGLRSRIIISESMKKKLLALKETK